MFFKLFTDSSRIKPEFGRNVLLAHMFALPVRRETRN